MELEYAVLAALLVRPEKALELELRPEEFADGRARRAYAAICDLQAEGKTAEPITIGERTNDLPFIAEIAQSFGSIGNLQHYAAGIRKAHKLREMARRGRELAEAATQRDADPDALAEELGRALVTMNTGAGTHEHDMKELMRRLCHRLDERMQAFDGGKTVGVPFGFRKWDQVLGGLQPGRLYVLGGRPKMGKSAFAISGMMNAARQGYRVGFASAEMSADECADRIASIVAGVDADRINRGELTAEEGGRIVAASSEIVKLPFRIFDLPAASPATIARQARAWALQHGLDLLVVDYLQRLRPDSKSQSRVNEVGTMAREFKTLAGSLKVPVVLLAQLSRELERRENKRPMMSDLRESGEIEQEADVIAFVYRDHVYNENSPETDAEILVQGNRHGPSGKIEMTFIPQRMLWCDNDLQEYREVAI